MNRETVLKFIKEFCQKQLYLSQDATNNITEDTVLNIQLEFDELDLVELANAIESQFDIQFDVEKFNLFTYCDWIVKDIIDDVIKCKNE